MKTAIISTSFWKDDLIFELNTDTRLFYLAILTNPERNTCPAFKCSDRIMSTFTGYDKNLLPLLREQLIEKDLIRYEDGYYIILGNGYIKPTKGKLSATLIEKYMNELPIQIRYLVEELLMSGSGVTHEYKDNNKDNTNYNTKYNAKDKELAELLKDKVESNFSIIGKVNIDVWAEDIRKLREIDKYTPEMIEFMIKWVQGGEYQGQNLPEHSFWSANIRSVAKLRKQKETIMAQIQQQYKLSNGIIKQQGSKPLTETI
jgi:hypothetical protein